MEKPAHTHPPPPYSSSLDMTSSPISQINNLSEFEIQPQELHDGKHFYISGTSLSFKSVTENGVLVYILKLGDGQEFMRFVQVGPKDMEVYYLNQLLGRVRITSTSCCIYGGPGTVEAYDSRGATFLIMNHKFCHGRMFVWNGYGQEYKITSPALNGVIGEFFTPLFGEKLKNEYKTLTNIETKVFTLGASLLIKKGLEKTRKITMIMMVVTVILVIANIILRIVFNTSRRQYYG